MTRVVPPLFRTRSPRPLAALALTVMWHRRPLAAVAAALALWCTIAALTPAQPATVPVVVAARELTGGHPLTAEDVRVADYPPDLAPVDAHADPGALLGRVLIGSAARGSPVGTRAVVAPRGPGPADGRSLVPIRLDDPEVTGLLQVGDQVDIVAAAADGSPARIIARSARVLALPAGDSGGGPFASAGASGGRLVLVEVSAGEATTLIEALARDRLSLILR